MRLATFNIQHGRSVADGAVDVDRFARAVRTLDADVLALQEVDVDQPRSHGADLTAVAAEAMGAVAHRFVATLHGEPGVWTTATSVRPPVGAAYGTALLTRFPVRGWRTLSLPRPYRRVPVVLEGQHRLTLVADEPRAAVAAVLATPEGPLTVVATHLTFVPGWNAVQLHRLARAARLLPAPLVLLGDLNLRGPWPARITGLVPLASLPTYPNGSPARQLDHVLAGPHVHPLAAATALDLGLSDHLALVVGVRLDDEGLDTAPRDEVRA